MEARRRCWSARETFQQWAAAEGSLTLLQGVSMMTAVVLSSRAWQSGTQVRCRCLCYEHVVRVHVVRMRV